MMQIWLTLAFLVLQTLAFQCTRYVAENADFDSYPCGASPGQPCKGLLPHTALFNLSSTDTLCLLPGVYAVETLVIPLGANIVSESPDLVHLSCPSGHANFTFVTPPSCAGNVTSTLQGILGIPFEVNITLDNIAGPQCEATLRLVSLNFSGDFGAKLTGATEIQLQNVNSVGGYYGWATVRGPQVELRLQTGGFIKGLGENYFAAADLFISNSRFSKVLTIENCPRAILKNSYFNPTNAQPAVDLLSSSLNIAYCSFDTQGRTAPGAIKGININGSYEAADWKANVVIAQRNWWSNAHGPKSCCQNDAETFFSSTPWVDSFVDFSFWSLNENFTEFSAEDRSSCTSEHCKLTSVGGSIGYSLVVVNTLILCIIGAVVLWRRQASAPVDFSLALEGDAAEEDSQRDYKLLDNKAQADEDESEAANGKTVAYLLAQTRIFTTAALIISICGAAISAYTMFAEYCAYDQNPYQPIFICVNLSTLAHIISAFSLFVSNALIGLVVLGLGFFVTRTWAALLMLVLAFIGAVVQVLLQSILTERMVNDNFVYQIVYFEFATSIAATFCLVGCVIYVAKLFKVLEAPLMRRLNEQVSSSLTLARLNSKELYRCEELQSAAKMNMLISLALPVLSILPMGLQFTDFGLADASWARKIVPFLFIAAAGFHSFAVVLTGRFYHQPFLALLCVIFQGTAIAGQLALTAISVSALDVHNDKLKTVYGLSTAIGTIITLVMLIRVWRFRNRVLEILPEVMAENISQQYIPEEDDS